jgi:YHS domain-containing protein
MATDFVCGADVNDDSRFFSDYDNKVWHFCSPECKRKFDDHPDHFIRERTTRELGIS